MEFHVFSLSFCFIGREKHQLFLHFERTSAFHLVILSTVFVAMPSLYTGEPTLRKCIVKPFITAIFYNLNVSILLVKSNKILTAFKSKIFVCKSEIWKENASELFVLALNMVIGIVIVVLFIF